MRATYEISGMHCGSCEAKISKAITELPGVTDVEVSAQRGEASIMVDGTLDESALGDAVAGAGNYRLGGRTGASDDTAHDGHGASQPKQSLYPLVLIVGFILGTVLLTGVAEEAFEPMTLMRRFMAGFFIVFSFFKLLDPPGFVSAYRGYDLLARRSKAWAWAYPYVELGLGVAYLLNLAPLIVNGITLVLMLIGAAGVLRALLDKRTIRCACLGTALNLPMTRVTLIEDLTMAVMAAVMLIVHAIVA